MSDSKQVQSRFGFSTGALEKSAFEDALAWLHRHQIKVVEFSALRLSELGPLATFLTKTRPDSFEYMSFHAPTAFEENKEDDVLAILHALGGLGYNIVVHPDVIYNPCKWVAFEGQLLIENMDRRKPLGRNAEELMSLFTALPEARLCLDIAHARQLDSTLVMLRSILRRFGSRVAEIHISELDSHCRHRPMSMGAVMDYQSIACYIDPHVPVIVESALDDRFSSLRLEELGLARKALHSNYELD